MTLTLLRACFNSHVSLISVLSFAHRIKPYLFALVDGRGDILHTELCAQHLQLLQGCSEALGNREVGQFIFITNGAETLSHLLGPVLLSG